MTYDVEIVLRGTDQAVTETVVHPGNDPGAWDDEDVRAVLKSMLLAIDRIRNPSTEEPRPVRLRGFSWIVEPTDDAVVIAVEIPSGAAVAGPFTIDRSRLDGMITRVLASAASSSAVH